MENEDCSQPISSQLRELQSLVSTTPMIILSSSPGTIQTESDAEEIRELLVSLKSSSMTFPVSTTLLTPYSSPSTKLLDLQLPLKLPEPPQSKQPKQLSLNESVGYVDPSSLSIPKQEKNHFPSWFDFAIPPKPPDKIDFGSLCYETSESKRNTETRVSYVAHHVYVDIPLPTILKAAMLGGGGLREEAHNPLCGHRDKSHFWEFIIHGSIPHDFTWVAKICHQKFFKIYRECEAYRKVNLQQEFLNVVTVLSVADLNLLCKRHAKSHFWFFTSIQQYFTQAFNWACRLQIILIYVFDVNTIFLDIAKILNFDINVITYSKNSVGMADILGILLIIENNNIPHNALIVSSCLMGSIKSLREKHDIIEGMSMISIIDIIFGGNAMDWMVDKNGGFHTIMSSGFSQTDVNSVTLVPTSGLVCSKTAFIFVMENGNNIIGWTLLVMVVPFK
ncbi:unnamed protein product [Vicia faba]|uniref:Uncharacterized protein n=1 Tax=Vicia faba TaxID=3906 RepID=A0AAV1B611_VICFA|nr:unnamed protein product [Vicia faba]